MAISTLSVKGIRSFKNLATVEFAIPDGINNGSGLNMLVGPNNSGKSSIIETLYLANNNLEMIPNTIRNSKSEGGVLIKIDLTNGSSKELVSMQENPAFMHNKYIDNKGEKIYDNRPLAYILSSKRNIGINLSTHSESWENFLYNNGGHNYRQENLSNNIGGRFKNIIESNKKIFDYELRQILGYLPKWSLDSIDANNLYISFKEGDTQHNNSGSGDGFINLFVILTSLYDAPPNSTIVIDEPEIALHPDVQRRLMERLEFHSKTKQIIISTHSPYFINLNLLNNGAKIFRFYKENENTSIYTVKNENIKNVNKLLNTIEQPYLQDIKSKEIFFLDKLILVEGPDDIYGYQSLFEKFNYKTSGSFYGWGVGGAERIKHLLSILHDLHYKKIVVILDNDKKELGEELSNLYSDYKVIVIDAKDIRDKEAPNIEKIERLINTMKNNMNDESKNTLDEFLSKYIKENEVEGFIKDRKKMIINSQYENNIKSIISSIKGYFKDIDENDDEVYELINNSTKETIAREILDNYIAQHPERTSRFIESKYLNYNFVSGGGNCEFVNTENNIYYFEMHQSSNTEKGEIVEVKIRISVDIENKTILNIAHTELKNTLG
ncbi:MAG: AAA family ATPase [Clostridia bacterium]|nr:AAA family ATPase [Clostridia bacterium]